MMYLVSGSMSTLQNVMQLIGVIIIFIIILIATYYTTKWIGAAGIAGGRSKNIKVIETYKISQNKFIQILKTGEKYIVIGISKDHIEYLTELDADELVVEENTEAAAVNFKDVFAKIKEKHKKKEQ